MEQKIVPHLWFDKEAVEAAEFYTSVFDNSKINFKTQIHDTPSGDCDIVGFQIKGYDFMAISAGPLFKINPSISFHAKCRTVEDVDKLWEKLSVGGTVMMELGEYPFSKRYGWIQDKYGVSWQVIYAEGDSTQRITPVLMFTRDVCGKAEEAVEFYTSVFPGSKSQVFARYTKGEKPDKEGTVKYAQFVLEGQEFGAMDSAHEHKFAFNEAVSLMVNCKDQKEIDYFWGKLSAVPEAEQCGWVKDKYGVSWQIVPSNMGALMSKNPEKTTPAMLKMKKIIIADLRKAGEER
ncbi:VOC family protein [Candidatus Woesearchaeota archaeon]|nr:VOC family protein [Candidatus Woesearchaeota archaeon]